MSATMKYCNSFSSKKQQKLKTNMESEKAQTLNDFLKTIVI